jgi:hypothetical protein
MKARLLLVMLVATVAFAPASEAALKRVSAAPGVQPSFVVRADSRGAGNGTVVVKSVKLEGTAGGAVRVECLSNCRRQRGGSPRVTHRGGDSTVGRLNVLLRKQQKLQFKVIVPSGTSRFVELGLRRGKLRVVGAGCLGARARVAACPAAVPAPGPQATPAPTPVPPSATPEATTTPTPTVTPVATIVPGANPRGAFHDAERLDSARVRVRGWARDADSDDVAISVRAMIDGSASGVAIANTAAGSNGPHGYDFVAVTDESAHTVCIIGLNIFGGKDAQLGSCRTFAAFADLDGNGKVGCSDVAILQANYDQAASYRQGDLNASGKVDIFDLSIMLSRFNSGETC